MIDINVIKEKNRIIDETIVKLKNDFVGIDKQIDQVMNSVRTWYLYPELQSSPVVVCLFGLTGTGKTALIRKIVEYLNIEKDLVYFNFAEINEMNSYEVENNIEDELSNEKSNRMFVYDEFQYAATLDEHGAEKDNRNGLKPFWELLDTGKIHKRSSFWYIRDIFKILSYITKINAMCDMRLENGVWVNAEECLNNFDKYDISQFAQVFNFDLSYKKEIASKKNSGKGKIRKLTEEEEIDDEEYEFSCGPAGSRMSRPDMFFIKDHYVEKILELKDKSDSKIYDKLDAYHQLTSLDVNSIIDLLTQIYEKASKGYDLNFNDSLIFVIANLDEAYTIAFDVNPDMSPDQFHKIAEKITVVDIKEALQKRFRNEQIARLGNTHIIYPAFSSSDFKKIIELKLDEYADTAKELTGFNFSFDKTICNIIYQESVFPTHGTRPVFSTIHELIKTKLPYIISSIYEGGYNESVDNIEYSYKNKKIVVKCFDKDGNILNTEKYDINLKLNDLRKSTKDEEQALCALHESGHFVVYSKLFDKIPEKLVSRTADNNSGGFLMEDIEDEKVMSKENLLNDIKVSLGGYVAEKMFFGTEKMSCGASQDLKNATAIASKLVRLFGMCDIISVTNHTPAGETPNLVAKDNDKELSYHNEKIENILRGCENEVKEIFEDSAWRNMLKEAAQYLAEHSSMPKKKMREIYDNVPADKKSVINDNFYRDTIKNL